MTIVNQTIRTSSGGKAKVSVALPQGKPTLYYNDDERDHGDPPSRWAAGSIARVVAGPTSMVGKEWDLHENESTKGVVPVRFIP